MIPIVLTRFRENRRVILLIELCLLVRSEPEPGFTGVHRGDYLFDFFFLVQRCW